MSITVSILGLGNWGLNFYGNYLADAPFYGEQYAVIAHTVGQQWFEYAVTPKWWSYLWLHEGLSTFSTRILFYLVRRGNRHK